MSQKKLIQLTRNDLYCIDQQIMELKKNGQCLALLLRKDIVKFYNASEEELKITKARYQAIQRKYIRMENGQFLTRTVNGTTTWDFIGHYKDDAGTIILGAENVHQKFNEECDRLMQQEITIEDF